MHLRSLQVIGAAHHVAPGVRLQSLAKACQRMGKLGARLWAGSGMAKGCCRCANESSQARIHWLVSRALIAVTMRSMRA
jgi:hypothetical protein